LLRLGIGLWRDARDGSVDPFLAEPDRDGLADSGAASGDEGFFALQTFYGVLPGCPGEKSRAG
jgi:hypothetical protein